MTLPLNLEGGHHPGPLFIIRKNRPLARPHGKQGAVHRAQTLRATPPWVDKQEIAKIYREAKRLSAESGDLFVVDHIVPKINKIVCGLHVPWNLRIIHWLENAKKGAWEWPDMPLEQTELPLE